MIFCNELGSQSLNIYHKLRFQSRLAKYSFWKFGSSFFRRWHWYSKYRNIHFWTQLTAHLSFLNSTERKIVPLKLFDGSTNRSAPEHFRNSNRNGQGYTCYTKKSDHPRPGPNRAAPEKIAIQGPLRTRTKEPQKISHQLPPSGACIPGLGQVRAIGLIFETSD